MKADDVVKELSIVSDKDRAVNTARYFKTGKGQYGEGDVFIGVKLPDIRKICRQFKSLSLCELQKLLENKIHECRMVALVILCDQYKKASEDIKRQIYELYLKELEFGNVNNWDLVDISCPHIVGEYALASGSDDLYKLAASDNLWQRRVAIISTSTYIRAGISEPTLKIARMLLNDKHDLIHKAVGWMLREVGKRIDAIILTDFLDENAALMPRTMLRYACEKLSDEKKKYYYGLKIKN